MPITFHNADIKFKLAGKAGLKKFIAAQVAPSISPPKGEKKAASPKIQLTYVFCSDEYLLQINRQFLNHDYYTDIITFPLSTPPAGSLKGGPPRPTGQPGLEAEIYISIDRVKDNALKLKVDFEEELLRVLFHGVLHLLGHKDKTKAQKAEMRKAENTWIRAYRRNG